MKCTSPRRMSFHRDWFDKRTICSRKCRADSKLERSELPQPQHHPRSYFEWLLAQPAADTRLRVATAGVRKR
jgi:hypothetical protein